MSKLTIPRYAATFSRMTFIRMTYCIIAFGRMVCARITFSKMRFIRMTYNKVAFGRMTYTRITLGRMTFFRQHAAEWELYELHS